MTAINIAITHDRVEMFTDGAALDGWGRMRQLQSKVRELPGLRCAIATRGPAWVLDRLAAILPTVAETFDGLRAAAKDGRLRGAVRRHSQLWFPFDLAVVGWGARGPGAFMLCNHSRHPGVKPWKPLAMPRGGVTPPVQLSAAETDAPVPHMRAIMDRQRLHLEPSLLIPGGRSMVGGFVERTTVMAAGVTTREMWRWPNEVGKPIGGGTVHRRAFRRFLLLNGALCGIVFVVMALGQFAWQALG